MNKWSIDEFVDVLNTQLPLTTLSTEDYSDKRRSSIWTKRMVRSYFANGELTPAIKEGKQRLYNENHLEEFRKLICLQYSGISYKTANSVLKSSYDSGIIESSLTRSIGASGLNNDALCFSKTSSSLNSCSNIQESTIDKKNNALELLKLFGSNSDLNQKNKMWFKEEISEGVELNIREDVLKDKKFIDSLKKWLNKQ